MEQNPGNFFAHIIRDPKVCGGEAVISGTRVTLRTVLACLADGDTPEDILADFPSLTETDVRAVIAYAAASAAEDLGIPPDTEGTSRHEYMSAHKSVIRSPKADLN